MSENLDAILAGLTRVLQAIGMKFANVFFSPGGVYSVTSLGSALLIASLFVWRRRVRSGRSSSPALILRKLFPEKLLKSASFASDARLFFKNAFVFGLVFGWAFVSFLYISTFASGGLKALLGSREALLPEWAARTLLTLIMFIAYEFAYWLDHYLSHRIPFLWEFHKVHHSAEHLTPLTAGRVHPVDSIVYGNIQALVMGLAAGAGGYALGIDAGHFAISGTNLILVLFLHAFVHLQHTELWITFRDWRGFGFMSPAHHQIHHSTNPAHFDRNFGSCLTLFDRLFGTLYVPSKEKEKLIFGVEGEAPAAFTITGELIKPFADAGKVAAGWVKPVPRPAAPSNPV